VKQPDDVVDGVILFPVVAAVSQLEGIPAGER
jgi:hypothetical protein